MEISECREGEGSLIQRKANGRRFEGMRRVTGKSKGHQFKGMRRVIGKSKVTNSKECEGSPVRFEVGIDVRERVWEKKS